MLHFQPGIFKYIQLKGCSVLNHKIFRWHLQRRKFSFSICCKIVMLLPSKVNICKASIFLRDLKFCIFLPNQEETKWHLNFRFTHSFSIFSPQVSDHPAETKCLYWNSSAIFGKTVDTPKAFPSMICKGKWWRSQKKRETKPPQMHQVFFAEIMAWPRYLHPFTLMQSHHRYHDIFLFGQCCRDNLSMTNRFSAILSRVLAWTWIFFDVKHKYPNIAPIFSLHKWSVYRQRGEVLAVAFLLWQRQTKAVLGAFQRAIFVLQKT